MESNTDSPFEIIGDTDNDSWLSEKYYCKALNGNINTFQIKVTKTNVGSVITCYYQSKLDSKVRITTELVKTGKNIGKKNQTNHYEQAESKALSKLDDKIKDGYKNITLMCKHYKEYCDVHNIKLIDYLDSTELFVKKLYSKISFNTDKNNRIKPMLANKANLSLLTGSVYVQPKLNGVRCLAMLEKGSYILLSRDGIVYDVPHITNALNALPQKYKYIFDGELYIHGTPLQNIVHAVRGTDVNDKAMVEYHIYDLLQIQTEQWERFYYRKLMFDNVTELTNKIVRVKTSKCNIDKVDVYFNMYRNEGYEGAIIRSLDGLYYPGYRTNSLLKLKADMSAEFEIVDIDTDTKTIADFNWVCITPEGLKFKVKAHGTVAEREHMARNSHEYIGKKLTLSFFEYTNDKIPFHITDMIIRDYE